MTTNEINFTRRTLTTATAHKPPPGKRAYFRDAKCQGLTLQVLPTGAASFQLAYRHLGKPTRVTLGRFDPALPDARQLPPKVDPLHYIAARPGLSVTMARALAAAARTAFAAGTSPAKHAQALRADPTVGELLDDYVAHVGARKRANSGASVRATLAHLTPVRGTRAADLTRSAVATLHAKVGKDVGGTMANRCLDTLRAAFNLALRNERIAARDNPATRIDRFGETKRDRYLTVDELALLRRALADERQDMQDIFELLLLTGARKSSVLYMRHADVDLQKCQWSVPPEHSKNGKSYTVELIPEAAAILARRADDAASPRVFGFADATLDRAWQRTFARMRRLKLLDALGMPASAPGTLPQLTAEAVRRRLPPDYEIEACTIHDLRRTFGSHAAMAGVSLHGIGKLLGHTSTRATAVYAQMSQTALRAATQRAVTTILPERA